MKSKVSYIRDFSEYFWHLQLLDSELADDEYGGVDDITDISKPDKTPFCFPVYSLSHNLVLTIYSENKDFHGYILLEKKLRSLDSFVNLFKRMEGCKKLIICFQSFYSVSVENHSIDKLIPHVKRWGKVFRAMISGGRLCCENLYCCQNFRHT